MPRGRAPASLQSRIEDAVWHRRPGLVTTADIVNLFGCTSATAARRLFQLEGAGRIQCWSKGVYFVPARMPRP